MYDKLLAAEDAAAKCGKEYGWAYQAYQRRKTKANLAALALANDALDAAIAQCDAIRAEIEATEIAQAEAAAAQAAYEAEYAEPKLL